MSRAEDALNLIAPLSGLGDAMKMLGAVPTSVSAPEVYTALERDTFQAASFPFTYSFTAYKLHEVSKWYTLGMHEAYEEADKKTFPLFEKRKLEVIEVTPEMRAKLMSTAAQPVWDHWAAETEKKGLPAKEALELVLSLSKKAASTN